MVNAMETGSWYIERTDSMKASGSMIRGKAKAWRNTVMETNTKGTLSRARRMAKGSITGLMVKSTMESGKMVSKMATVCGRESLEILT